MSLSALAIAPREPVIIYAAVTFSTYGPYGLVGLDGTLFKSVDGGQSWEATGLAGVSVRSIAFDAAEARTLYAVAASSGKYETPNSIRKSTDGGLTWITVRGGLPFGVSAVAMAAEPTGPGVVSVAYSGLTSPSFIEKTVDGGATWLPVAPPPSGTPTALAAGGGSTYLATSTALFRSSDSESTWSGLLSFAVNAIGIAPSQPATIYVGSGAVSFSRDAGNTWTSSTAGLTNTSVFYLAAATAPAGTLYSSAGHTVFRRAAGEDTWHPFSALPTDAFVQGVAVHPTNPFVQLSAVITYDGFCRGIRISSDGGASWTQSGLNIGCILRITFDPRNPDVVFAQGQFGLWKSTDTGIHWSDIVAAAFRDLAFASRDPDVIFAATNRSVMRSNDGGLTWLPSDTGIPLSRFGCSSDGTVCPKRLATAIAIDPRDNSTLYAAAADLPISYSPFPLPPAVDTGFFRSTDGGATWHLAGSGLPPVTAPVPHTIGSLVVDPANSDNVYAATDEGVFRSTDQGRTFAALNEGLANTAVSSLLFDPSGRSLHAATQGNGVFDIDPPRGRPAVAPVSRRPSTHPVLRP